MLVYVMTLKKLLLEPNFKLLCIFQMKRDSEWCVIVNVYVFISKRVFFI